MAKKNETLTDVLGPGKKPGSGKLKKIAEDAIAKVDRLRAAAARSKEQLGEVTLSAMYATETLAGVAVSHFAEGYLGEEKIKVFGVDLRAAAAVAGIGFGIFKLLKGDASGHHFINVGMGPGASFVASRALSAGRAFAASQGQDNGTVIVNGAPVSRKELERLLQKDLDGDGAIGLRQIPANPSVQILDPFGTTPAAAGRESWKVAAR